MTLSVSQPSALKWTIAGLMALQGVRTPHTSVPTRRRGIPTQGTLSGPVRRFTATERNVTALSIPPVVPLPIHDRSAPSPPRSDSSVTAHGTVIPSGIESPPSRRTKSSSKRVSFASPTRSLAPPPRINVVSDKTPGRRARVPPQISQGPASRSVPIVQKTDNSSRRSRARRLDPGVMMERVGSDSPLTPKSQGVVNQSGGMCNQNVYVTINVRRPSTVDVENFSF